MMMAGCLAGCGSDAADDATTTPEPEATESTDAAEATESDAAEEASGDEITLTFWSWLPTTDQSEEMIAAFEEANPGIKIDYTRTEQYAPFAEEMSALADANWSGWSDVISETAVEQCTTEDGSVVGMPLLMAGMTDLLYNKTLMDECGIEKVPTTYEELKDAAAKAKEKGYVCVAVGAADDWINSDIFVQLSNEFEEGAVYQAEKGERPWTDQCFVDTMTAWQQMFNDGIFEEGALGVATYPDARDQYFFARKSVFFLTGSWHLGPTSPTNSEIEGTEIANNNDVIGMCVFPSVVDDGKICGTAGVDVMIAVNKDCKEKEAAMKFVEYMANGDGQQYWVNKLQGAPVSKEISYTGTVDGELQQQSIDEVNSYVSNAVGNRKLSNSEVERAIQIAMQNVAAGADPVAELEEVQNVQDAQ